MNEPRSGSGWRSERTRPGEAGDVELYGSDRPAAWEPIYDEESEFEAEYDEEPDDEEPDDEEPGDEEPGIPPGFGPGEGWGEHPGPGREPKLVPGPRPGPGPHPGPPHEHGPGVTKTPGKKAPGKKAPGKKAPGKKASGPSPPPPYGHGPGRPEGPGPEVGLGFRPGADFGFDFGFGFGQGGTRGRGGFRSGRRGRRGDIRAAILTLLAERPMHGYEMIREITERSRDLWRPSPGSVYPTLQLLDDEGLVTGSESEGSKKLFELTDKGRDAAEKIQIPPWEEIVGGVDVGQVNLRAALGQLFGAVAQSAYTASAEQQQRILAILKNARREIYLLLAESD